MYLKTGKLSGLILCLLPLYASSHEPHMSGPIEFDSNNPFLWTTIGLMSVLIVLSAVLFMQQSARRAENQKKESQSKSETEQTQNQGEDIVIPVHFADKKEHETISLSETLQALHTKENFNLLQQAVNNTSDGIFIADSDYQIVYVNNAYLKFTGENHLEVLNSPLKFKQYPTQFEVEVKNSLSSNKHWSGELDTVTSNGKNSTITLRIDAIMDEQNNTSHFVGVFSDITEQKNTEKELLKLANVDSLTQLPNRSYFHSYQQYLIRTGAPHALLCFDLDNFKKINDSVGHTAGDQLLQQVVKRMENMIRKNMIAFRLGGDEFAIIIEGRPEFHRLSHFAQSVLDKLAQPYQVYGQEFVVKASIGIAFYPTDGKSPQEILKNADTAMYFAKNLGGNRYQFFQEQLNQDVVKQLHTENLIRYGLQHELFRVYYQPKVNVKTGQLCGMEALVRFEHPEHGLVNPADFIPMAEETGQILEIGERVLEMACRDTARWVSQGLLKGKVAINIAALQFKQADFAIQVRNILDDAGLSPEHLECEITEGTLMDSPEDALNVMLALRTQGVQLALDDFGTGYSSLAYLKQFPISTLKIDKAFIEDIDTNHTDKNMVEAIINIAHNLGLEVVAEGVESEAQLAVLSDFGCEMLQGYLFSKPLSAEKFEKLLRAEGLSRQQVKESKQRFSQD